MVLELDSETLAELGYSDTACGWEDVDNAMPIKPEIQTALEAALPEGKTIRDIGTALTAEETPDWFNDMVTENPQLEATITKLMAMMMEME